MIAHVPSDKCPFLTDSLIWFLISLYIPVGSHIVTISTGTMIDISLMYDEAASSDIILPIKIVICLMIESTRDTLNSAHYVSVAMEKTSLRNQNYCFS